MPREGPFEFAFDSPAAAIGALVERIRPVDAETVLLEDALGRILAEDVAADRPSPPVDMSSMDGFAVRVGEVRDGVAMPVAGEVRIGLEPPPLAAGSCMRIVTGGAIPPGTEAVVKREDVTERDGRVLFRAGLRVRAGDNIRRAGENLSAGAVVISRGSRITTAVAGALAAFGVRRPPVFRMLTVGVITTGDEVVDVSDTPTPWQLRDSNASSLHAMLESLRVVEVRHTRVPDDAARLNDAVAHHLKTCDALLMTGGVSMGHRDFVGDALAAGGVQTVFHGLPQRPGKPMFGGVTDDGRPVFGLPGNPVSVLVTARRIASIALMARAGTTGPSFGGLAVPMLVEVDDADDRAIDLWWHRPVRLTQVGSNLVGIRSSGDIGGVAESDGFVELPPRATGPGPWPFYAW
jgi:molybdopterin molybdotransferase